LKERPFPDCGENKEEDKRGLSRALLALPRKKGGRSQKVSTEKRTEKKRKGERH